MIGIHLQSCLQGEGKTRNFADSKPSEGCQAAASHPRQPAPSVHLISHLCVMGTWELTFIEHLLCACHCAIHLAGSVSFNPPNYTRSSNCYDPHFRAEEMKVQTGTVTFSIIISSNKWWRWNFNPNLLTAEFRANPPDITWTSNTQGSHPGQVKYPNLLSAYRKYHLQGYQFKN